MFRAEASVRCQGGSGSVGTWGLVSVQPPVLSFLLEATLFWPACPGTLTTLCPATAHLRRPPTCVRLITASVTSTGVR